MKNKTPGYPIMFSRSMVVAMLEDRKTKTRRKVKAIAPPGAVKAWQPDNELPWFRWENESGLLIGDSFSCPFGVAGDLLYVREEFRVSGFYDRMSPAQIPALDTVRIQYVADNAPLGNMGKKRENMYMPRWMSRLTLELVSIRIERLQEISDHDCMAEGLCPQAIEVVRQYKDEGAPLRGGSPERYLYAKLWEELHGEGSWQINPFVWVLEFSVLNGNIDNILEERISA